MNLLHVPVDKEELRMDKAVKVTKKELNDLVAELFEFEDMFSKNQIEPAKKKNTPDNSLTIVQDSSTVSSIKTCHFLSLF